MKKLLVKERLKIREVMKEGKVQAIYSDDESLEKKTIEDLINEEPTASITFDCDLIKEVSNHETVHQYLKYYLGTKFNNKNSTVLKEHLGINAILEKRLIDLNEQESYKIQLLEFILNQPQGIIKVENLEAVEEKWQFEFLELLKTCMAAIVLLCSDNYYFLREMVDKIHYVDEDRIETSATTSVVFK